jgi:hypothetical protein
MVWDEAEGKLEQGAEGGGWVKTRREGRGRQRWYLPLLLNTSSNEDEK